MKAVSSDSDFEIQELDEIIAIEILLGSYGIDVVQLNKKQVKHIIKLLGIVLLSTKVSEE